MLERVAAPEEHSPLNAEFVDQFGIAGGLALLVLVSQMRAPA